MRRAARATRRAAGAFSCAGRQAPATKRACARRILSTLARRAYRRPVTDADLAGAAAVLRRGPRPSAISTPASSGVLERMLVSPEFLFRIERDRAASARAPGTRAYPRQRSRAGLAAVVLPLEQHPGRRAARRWRSAGSCSDPAMLEAQVRRMLADPRAAGARRQLRRPVAVPAATSPARRPDPRLFPDFDDELRQAMRRETELFFDSIVREDRSVARPADRRLHVRQRAAGAALRHSGRLRQPSSGASTLARRARGAGCSGRAAS